MSWIKNFFLLPVFIDFRILSAESTSDAEKLNNKLMSILDDESPTDSKKYVSFKEMVERIEVLEDQDEDKS